MKTRHRRQGSAPKLKRVLLPDLKDRDTIRRYLKEARNRGDLESYSEFLKIHDPECRNVEEGNLVEDEPT